ncbi:Methyltransferase [Gammaproteobacteria bacterium]
MTSWTGGYIADVGYTYGYYTELNPLRAPLAFLTAGLVPPETGTHCELGFGQGLSVNIHAAASGNTWYATDFNPTQAGFAQMLARTSGAHAHLHDDAFADFCQRADLPYFDSIGLHGIWSWISDENRAVIVDFVRRKLRVGGVLYISYNTQPGWAAMVPVRDLLTEHAAILGASGQGIISRIDASLAFAEKLLATHPLYARINPQVADRLKKIQEQNRHYLAHEYFNRDWLPMPFARMAEWLAPAKLGFACSAHYIDHLDTMNLNDAQKQLIHELPDPLFRETVRDFCVNQQFRRDYWVKGARRLNTLEQGEALRAHRVILIQPRSTVSLKAAGALGEANLSESIYNPILDHLADHKPKTLGQLEQALKEISFSHLLEAALLLTSTGSLAAVQEESLIAKAKRQTDKLNAYLMDKARGSDDIGYLASPVIGGGIPVARFHQLMLLARTQGRKQPAEWAAFVWQILSAQGRRLIKEGQTLATAEENLAELSAQAQMLADQWLPVLKALQIA